MAISKEDKKDVQKHMGKALANKVSKVTRDKPKRGNYSIFRKEVGGGETRIKHNLSHKEMHHELKNNPEYRGTDKYGFAGGRTYGKK